MNDTNFNNNENTDNLNTFLEKKNSKPIWVAWNDNSAEKQLTISGVNSSSAKITEAVPNYESGKEVKDYATAFKVETKPIVNNKLTLTLNEVPVFVEEN
jgi:hypothetical protein